VPQPAVEISGGDSATAQSGDATERPRERSTKVLSTGGRDAIRTMSASSRGGAAHRCSVNSRS
jgi:hypothetical protein